MFIFWDDDSITETDPGEVEPGGCIFIILFFVILGALAPFILGKVSL